MQSLWGGGLGGRGREGNAGQNPAQNNAGDGHCASQRKSLNYPRVGQLLTDENDNSTWSRGLHT
eukprot:3888642-Lingulodinium_polyedra.AAC.1